MAWNRSHSSTQILGINSHLPQVVDATEQGNLTRHLNHYQDFSAPAQAKNQRQPNAQLLGGSLRALSCSSASLCGCVGCFNGLPQGTPGCWVGPCWPLEPAGAALYPDTPRAHPGAAPYPATWHHNAIMACTHSLLMLQMWWTTGEEG